MERNQTLKHTTYLNALLSAPKDGDIKTLAIPTSIIKPTPVPGIKKNKNIKRFGYCEKWKKPSEWKEVTCCFCNESYKCEINTHYSIYYEMVKQIPPEGTVWFGNRYDKVERQRNVCLSCQNTNIINCNNCGELFNMASTVDAWNDPLLTKNVTVCVQCYSYEACTGCGYLGGASPCRWCRHM